MANVQWTRVAEQDLEDAVYFIGVVRRKPETALKLYFERRACVDEYFREGRTGHYHPAFPLDWKYLQFKRWLVAFVEEDGEIIVRRVIDSSRDIKRVLDSEE